MGKTKFIIQKENKLPSVSGSSLFASYRKKGHRMALCLYTLAITVLPMKNNFLQKYGMKVLDLSLKKEENNICF